MNKNKRICITGGRGFLGTHQVNKFKEKGYKNIFIADIDKYDLRELPDVKRMYRQIKPDIVVHLAAWVGGIGVNRENPGEFFYDNLTLLLSEIYAGTVQGRQFVEWLS